MDIQANRRLDSIVRTNRNERRRVDPKYTVVLFSPENADGIADVCRELEWNTYDNPEIVRRSCTAPGVTTCVALLAGETVGFSQVVGDGMIQGCLTLLGVKAAHRRQGIAKELVTAAFHASGVQRLDLITDDAQSFYESFPHRTKAGYRIYPDAQV